MPFRHGGDDEQVEDASAPNPGRPSRGSRGCQCLRDRIRHVAWLTMYQVGKIVKMGPGTENSPRKVGDRVGIKWVRHFSDNLPSKMSLTDSVPRSLLFAEAAQPVYQVMMAFVSTRRSPGITRPGLSSSMSLDRQIMLHLFQTRCRLIWQLLSVYSSC